MSVVRALSDPTTALCGLLAFAPFGDRAAAPVRELTTDRPDATESPFTVEPGHVQLEMDFANHTRARQAGTPTVGREIAPFAVRCGLTPNLEAGVQVVPFRSEREALPGGGHETRSGRGDTTLRAKLNLQGNDGAATAWGVIVDLKLPTGSRALTNGKSEGAVMFPFAFGLPAGWSGGAMTSAALLYSDRGRYRPVWTNTFTAGHAIAGRVRGFLELTSETGDGGHVAMFDCGLTRSLGTDAQIDGGLKIGLSRAAPDLTVFAGISRRF